MNNIISVRGVHPSIHSNSFIAPSAQVIGNVKIGEKSSVWFNSVLRGDVAEIVIGDETNIQDGCVVHGTFNKHATHIGKRVTVGHLVMLHGCTVGDKCLIGMGSILMDGCQISERSVVAAGSLVSEGKSFPPGVLIMGRPAKVVRELTAEELAFLDKSADNYILYQSWYKNP